MKIITGGAGFIGSAICWRLNLDGYKDILLVDSDLNGTKKNNLEGLKYSDYLDKDTFLERVAKNSFSSKVETIYHMGACSSTTEEDMEFLKRNNVEFSKSLAKYCIENNTRYIYASSAATYGDGELGFDDDHELIPKLKPLNKYGLSKQMFDMWVLDNKLQGSMVGLKYFNVFGPNENHKGDMRSMVNKQYKNVVSSGKIRLFKSEHPDYKDGEQKRDFVYVKDAVEMTVFFDNYNPVGFNKNGIYNIGSGVASTWNQLANAIFSALGREPVIEYIDMPDNLKNQYQYYSKANLSKIRNAGYKNDIPELSETVKDYVRNYLMKDEYLKVK